MLAESIDQKVLKRSLLAFRQQRRSQITDPATESPEQAQLFQCSRGHANGIVKKATKEIDSALPLAHQHHQVFGARIWGCSRRRNIALLSLVAKFAGLARVSFDWHHIEPPAHHSVGL